MRIIGFNLTKILAEKQEKAKEKVQIDQNINIRDISEEKIPISDEKALKISFSLTIVYSDNYAKIEFDGNVLILVDKNELKKFLDAWKNKKIPEQERIPVFNFIMSKCNIKSLVLEDEMALPLHLPLPRLSPTNPQTTK